MFEQEEKKQKLVNAQRKTNDFRDFFNSEQKAKLKASALKSNESQYDLQQTYSTLDGFHQNQPSESRQSLLLHSQKAKQYIKDSKVDKFLNSKIKGKSLSDSQTLDQFLQHQKEWANKGRQVPIQQVLHDKYMKDPDYSLHYTFQSKGSNPGSIISSSKNNTNSFIHQSNSVQNKSQQNSSFASSAFAGPPRFWLSKNSNTNGNTTLNGFVADSTRVENNPEFMNKLLVQSQKSFDLKRINMKHPEELGDPMMHSDNQRIKEILDTKVGPTERKKQLDELKGTLTEYQNWKRDQTYKEKQLGIMKNRYRSGVLSLDGPFVENSIIYRDQNKSVKEEQMKKEMLNKERVNKIERYFLTNPDVDFANKNKINTQTNSKQRLFPQKSHVISSTWKHRRLGNNLSQKLPTFENCFGHNLEDQKQLIHNSRSQYLREKDLGGKDFNPLTGAMNESLF